MKTNNQVFVALVAVLYGMVCFVLLVTGYTVNDCVLMIGAVTGLYLGISLILMFGRMLLVAASESSNGDGRTVKRVLSLKVPNWVVDWMDRVGNAGLVVLDLLPVMRNTIMLFTLCLGMLTGVHYLLQMGGSNDVVTVLLRMTGTLGGLYLMHVVSMAAVSWIERSDMITQQDGAEYVSRPLGSR